MAANGDDNKAEGRRQSRRTMKRVMTVAQS